MAALLLCLSVSHGVAAEPKGAGRNVHGKRYGEILVINGSTPWNLVGTVYNTIGCNDCPEAEWRAIDPVRLKKRLGAVAIIMNGPRYFLMDSIVQSAAPSPRVMLEGLEFIERATLPILLHELLKGKSKKYREQVVHRVTRYTFDAGSRIYLLESPLHAYVMQSYTRVVDPSLTEADLASLGNRLRLPSGWRFRAVILSEPLTVNTAPGGVAYVIRDDLENTYQRIR